MRYKDLVEWVNKEFERFEITEYRAVEAVRTYHNQDAIEGGACRMLIFFECVNQKTMGSPYFLCFYTLKQLNTYLKEGFEMYLDFKHSIVLTNITIEVRRKKLITNP